MEEIIDAVSYEIENSGYMDKLSAGIVLTGGGSMLRHLNQLVKFKTGMDVRIGFPSEKLAADTSEEINQPMYSTSIGLLLKGLEYYNEKGEEMIINEEKAENAEKVSAEIDERDDFEAEEEKRVKKGIEEGEESSRI